MKTAMKNFAIVLSLVVGAASVAHADVVPATPVAPPTPMAAGIATPVAAAPTAVAGAGPQQPGGARATSAASQKQQDPTRRLCLQHAAYAECATREGQLQVLARYGLQAPQAARPLANSNVTTAGVARPLGAAAAATPAPQTAAPQAAAPQAAAPIAAAPTTIAAAPTPATHAAAIEPSTALPTDSKTDTTTTAAGTTTAPTTTAPTSFLDKTDPALATAKDGDKGDKAKDVKDSAKWTHIGAIAPSLPLGSIAIGGLAVIIGIFALLRRKKPNATKATLEILATRSLGGKARIVWLVAGNRELVISVAGNNVGLLSQWMRPSSNEAASDESYSSVAMSQLRARDIDDAIEADNSAVPADNFSGIVEKPVEASTMSSRYAANATPAPTTSTPASITQISALATTLANSSATHTANAANAAANSGQSAAVSGLLRLRDRSGGTSLASGASIAANDANTDMPTADGAHWAKNILAAIGQRGARS